MGKENKQSDLREKRRRKKKKETQSHHRLHVILQSSDLLFDIISRHEVINDSAEDLELLDTIGNVHQLVCYCMQGVRIRVKSEEGKKNRKRNERPRSIQESQWL